MEITVLDIETPSEFSKEERVLQIENLTTGLQKYIIESFIELDNIDAELKNRLTRPDMEEFLLRKILDYDSIIPHTDGTKIIELHYPKKVIREYRMQLARREPFSPGKLTFEDHGSMSGDIRHNELFVNYYPWNLSLETRLGTGVYDYFYISQMKLLNGTSYLKFNLETAQDLFDYLKYVYEFHNSILPFLLYKPVIPEQNELVHVYQDFDRSINKNIAEFLQLFSVGKIETYTDVAREGIMDMYDDMHMGIDLANKVPLRMIKLELMLKEIEHKREEVKKLNEKSLKQWLYFNTFGKEMQTITSEQEEILQNAYERYMNYWNAYENNDCPHISILESFNNAVLDSDKLRYLKQLYPYFGEEKNYIVCNNCGYDIICPHVRDLWEAKTNKRNVLTKYIAKVPIFGKYYCKICGEELFETEEKIGITKFMGGEKIVFREVEDELRELSWKTTNQVVRSVVKFELIPDRMISNMISVMADTIVGSMKTIEGKLMKSKTDTKEGIKDKLKMFANIYVYALLVKIMKENPKVKFTAIKGLRIKSQNDIKTLFHNAYTVLKSTRESLFNRISEITDDSIKTYLFNAYKELSGTKLDVSEEQSVLERNLQFLYYDPFYHWLLKIHQSLYEGPAKTEPKLSDTMLLIGKKEELAEETNLYDNIKLPDLKIEKPDTLQGMEYNILMNSFQKIVKGDYSGVSDQIYLDLAGFLSMRRYNFISGSLPLMYVAGQLSKIYGKDHKHKWNIYIYNKDTLSISELNEKLSKGESMNDQYIKDRKCSICGDLYSSTSEVRASLIEQNEIEAFYNEYERRCPIQKNSTDYYHDWKNDKCEKCKVTREMIMNHDKAYFKKYKPDSTPKQNEIVLMDNKEKIDLGWVDYVKKWTYSLGTITQLTNLFSKYSDIKKNVISNIVNSLGLTEDSYFDDIEKGKEIQDDISREYKLNGYIQYILQNYGMLSQGYIPNHISEMVEEMQKKKRVDFSTLPSIGNDYISKYEAMRQSDKNINQFLLMYLTELINQISVIPVFSDFFLKHVINHIITCEKNYALLSRAEEIKLMRVNKTEYIGDAAGYESEEEEDIETERGSRFTYFDIDYDGANDEDNNVFDM